MNYTFPQSERLRQLPPYIFSEINAIKAEAVKQGKTLLSLGIGDPDKPTPTEIIAKIQECAAATQNHVYSPYEGTLAFRTAASEWMQRRFGVTVSAEKEMMAVIGSKEAIAHFPLGFLNPGDRALYPSPGYPVFSTSISLNGGIPIPMPLRADQGFLPDPDELARLIEQHQPRYMILNFPSNPTSAFCTRERLTAIVKLAQKHGIMVLQDNAYSEIYFDEAKKPISILEIPGAMEVAVELHSFSKSYNMTGWRIGFAAGNASLVAGLLRAKTNIDSGPLLSVQAACPFILQNSERFSASIRQLYKDRRDALCAELDAMGIEYLPAQGTMFVWARVPGGSSSMELCKQLIQSQGLVITPGVGFGAEGEGFFRMALTVDTPEIVRSAALLRKYLGR